MSELLIDVSEGAGERAMNRLNRLVRRGEWAINRSIDALQRGERFPSSVVNLDPYMLLTLSETL
jgi:hypothetical protein